MIHAYFFLAETSVEKWGSRVGWLYGFVCIAGALLLLLVRTLLRLSASVKKRPSSNLGSWKLQRFSQTSHTPRIPRQYCTYIHPAHHREWRSAEA